MTTDRRTLDDWREHWQDEADAAYLYAALAALTPESKGSGLCRRLADVEARHAAMWAAILGDHGVALPAHRPTLKARIMAGVARVFGPGVLFPMMLREEGREVQGYLRMHRDSAAGPAKDAALTLAKESAEHAGSLAELAGVTGEPWHHVESGGFVRNVVYGFNDGLTANFGLVAGVIGAAVEPRVVVVSGLAGLIADALSMGASGFLAAKSEAEVHAHEIAMERDEIRLMPDVEEEELAILYEAKGVEPERAKSLARDLRQDPERMLAEKVKAELKIGDPHTTPLKEGLITGTATAVGALLPVAPFFLLAGTAAVWTSFALSMLSHFGVGAARSVFTGRGLLRSGLDMFVIGIGVAAIGYAVGMGLARIL